MSDPFTAIMSAVVSSAINSGSDIMSSAQDRLEYERDYQTTQQNYALQQQQYELEKANSEYNREQQAENLEWLKSAQETTWNREDNAIQRRAADLKAAGLSKTLAAGSAAASSSPVHISSSPISAPSGAPQMGQLPHMRRQDQAAIMSAALEMSQNFMRTQSDIKLAEKQGRRIDEERKGLEIDNQIKADTKQAKTEQIIQQTELIGWDVVNRALESKIKKLDITEQDIKIAKEKINLAMAEKYQLDEKKLELVAAQLAIDQKLYDLNLSKELQLRTGDKIDPISGASRGIAGTLGSMMNQIMDNIRANNAARASQGADKRKKQHGASGSW